MTMKYCIIEKLEETIGTFGKRRLLSFESIRNDGRLYLESTRNPWSHP